eukprot:4926381-Amphidinium_carterae.1
MVVKVLGCRLVQQCQSVTVAANVVQLICTSFEPCQGSCPSLCCEQLCYTFRSTCLPQSGCASRQAFQRLFRFAQAEFSREYPDGI